MVARANSWYMACCELTLVLLSWPCHHGSNHESLSGWASDTAGLGGLVVSAHDLAPAFTVKLWDQSQQTQAVELSIEGWRVLPATISAAPIMVCNIWVPVSPSSSIQVRCPSNADMALSSHRQ